MSKAVIKLGEARAFALALPGAEETAFQQPASTRGAGATAIAKSPPAGEAKTSRLPSVSRLTTALTPWSTLIWPVTSGGT